MISIIIPVYNREHTIRRAVDSVLKQSCQDFELILVDDGSTDGSPEICQSYVRQDKRIRFFHHEENRGVSVARNTGLKEASGQYIRFVDSDDELPEKSLEDLLQPVLEDCTLELVVARIGGDDKKHPDFAGGLVTRKEFLRQYIQPAFRSLFQHPGNKLYLRKVIERNGLLFDETFRYGEDVIFNFRYYANIDKIFLLNKVVYQLHHPNGEPGHLSDVRTRDIGEIFRLIAVQKDTLHKAAEDLPDCWRNYEVIIMGTLWRRMRLLGSLGDYPSFKNAVNSYDWETLLEAPNETYGWKFRFLCNGLRKKRAGRLFCFFTFRNWVYAHLIDKAKQLLRPVVHRCRFLNRLLKKRNAGGILPDGKGF